MILKIKNKLKNKDTKILISNFSYLSLIEVSNYILPFLAIPYIVRVIGVEKYGIITFSYAVMVFFNTFTDFGFRLLATKYISINRGNLDKVSKHFWTVLFSKVPLILISFIVLIILVSTVEKFNQEKSVFLISFIIVIGNALFPIWFFQGMEKMKYIAIFNFLNRAIYTALVFLLVKKTEDYIYIPLFNSLCFIVIAIISLYFAHKEFKVRFFLVTVKDITQLFKDGWHLFLSRLSTSLYTSANTVFLGLLTSYNIVGIVSLATTIIQAVIKIIAIFNNVTFPYIAKYADNKKTMRHKARSLLRLYSIVLLLTSISTFIFASPIINLLFGLGHDESILLLKILSLLILLEPLGGFFTLYLINQARTKTVSKITFLTMLVNFIFIFPLVFLFQGIGFVITRVIVQAFQVLLNVSHNKELVISERKNNLL